MRSSAETKAESLDMTFLLDSNEFKNHGFNEIKLSRFLRNEQTCLMEKLVMARKHNQRLIKNSFTQTRVGERMNVSQAYVSRVENGTEDLVDLLISYAQAAGIRIEFKVSSAVDNVEMHTSNEPHQVEEKAYYSRLQYDSPSKIHGEMEKMQFRMQVSGLAK